MTDAIITPKNDDTLPYHEIELDPGEGIKAKIGSLIYSESEIEIKSIPKNELLMGGNINDRFLIASFVNTGIKKSKITFAAPFPGQTIVLEISSLNGQIICQGESFLCAAQEVTIEKLISKKLSAGIIGEEHLDLFGLSGDGTIILHAGGTSIEKDLEANEAIQLDPSCLVSFASTVDYEIKYIRSFPRPTYEGNGLRLIILKGPGKIYLQSLPISRLAKKIYSIPND